MQNLFENWNDFLLLTEIRTLLEKAGVALIEISSLDQAYKILGLQRGASKQDAKKAYRAIALKYHPDITGGDPEKSKLFLAAKDAYEAITDTSNFEFGSEESVPQGNTDPTSMWQATGREGMEITNSLRNMINIISNAIDLKQSVKVDLPSVKVPAPITIDSNDFRNFVTFMTNYQYRNLRSVMGQEQFIKDKILNTLKSVSISPKFGTGAADLQTFVDAVSKILPEETAEKPGQSDPQPASSTKKSDDDKLTPDDIEMFKNMGIFENWREFLNEKKNPRIPRKKGQPAKSKKHSDLYTDEDPKGTIHGLGYKDEATARASVTKIRNSSRSHAHKTQAAIAMEQRAKAAGKSKEAAIFRKFIEQQKKKTKAKDEKK